MADKKVNIVERLRKASDRFVAEGLVITSHMMQEAADEIEYLRQRCEEIDNEWRMTFHDQNGKGMRE